MKLRPHHLLCTLGFVGLGYSEEFVENMTLIVEELKNQKTEIVLVVGIDDICLCCPKNISNIRCKEDSVTFYDEKVLEVFGFKEGAYVYKDLIKTIKEIATFENLEYICGDCSWFENCQARKNVL